MIEARAKLSLTRIWGQGMIASSDGQFLLAMRQQRALNLGNAICRAEPWLMACTNVLNQYGAFATQLIPATVNCACYILDELVMTTAGRCNREQYADTGVFTDVVFVATAPPPAIASFIAFETCSQNSFMSSTQRAYRI